MGCPEFSKSIIAQRINMLRSICKSSDSKFRRMTQVMQTQVLVVNMAEKAGRFLMLTKGMCDGEGLLAEQRKTSKSVQQQSPSDTQSNTLMNLQASYFSETEYITRVSL